MEKGKGGGEERGMGRNRGNSTFNRVINWIFFFLFQKDIR